MHVECSEAGPRTGSGWVWQGLAGTVTGLYAANRRCQSTRQTHLSKDACTARGVCDLGNCPCFSLSLALSLTVCFVSLSLSTRPVSGQNQALTPELAAAGSLQ